MKSSTKKAIAAFFLITFLGVPAASSAYGGYGSWKGKSSKSSYSKKGNWNKGSSYKKGYSKKKSWNRNSGWQKKGKVKSYKKSYKAPSKKSYKKSYKKSNGNYKWSGNKGSKQMKSAKYNKGNWSGGRSY